MRFLHRYFLLVLFSLMFMACNEESKRREIIDFNRNWEFAKIDSDAPNSWRRIDLPHDWSIEGSFDPEHPAGVGGGALPGGKAVYKKAFRLSLEDTAKNIFVQFDGVYQNSTVYVNGKLVGNRPNGYISFEYDISNLVDFEFENQIWVEVDNSQQPNSRWYSGSGIYRDVRLVKTAKVYIPQYGVHIKPVVNDDGTADILLETIVSNNSSGKSNIELKTSILSPDGQMIVQQIRNGEVRKGNESKFDQVLNISSPDLWSPSDANLYTAVSQLYEEGRLIDETTHRFGVRTVLFDSENGFSLNGNSMKIKGVCLHHDLGALGAAFNRRAMQRQLEIMKEMGVNAIRTAHNPPATQVLDLCDEMGLMVMDEIFDVWSKGKVEFDYSMYWDAWHQKDLEDFVKRDRNHPSVIIWSIGNEIIEQYDHSDSLGGEITRELASIVQGLDDSRIITTGNNDPSPDNTLIKNGGLELIGYNYNHSLYQSFAQDHPGKIFIATETNSGLATRGYYDMPSDSTRIWPERWDKVFLDGNPDHTVSAYDHVRVPWGSLQNETWPIIRDHNNLTGMFIWTGFDYLGEPTPYIWPSRSSYFGIVDLAGFPKDTYYYYQSEWTRDTVLHVFPHWNWKEGNNVDVWVYYSQAEEVELFINDRSLGIKQKKDSSHVSWRVPFEPGVLMAQSRTDDQIIKEVTIATTGAPSQISLKADREVIRSDGYDLSFVTVELLDENGRLVPNDDRLVEFSLEGVGTIQATDNGDPTDHTSFISHERSTLHGKALVIIKSTQESGLIQLTAHSKGLNPVTLSIQTN
jgi:beta-galactosidase